MALPALKGQASGVSAVVYGPRAVSEVAEPTQCRVVDAVSVAE